VQGDMAALAATALVGVILGLASGAADAQGVAELFGEVASTVVVIHSKSLSPTAGDGQTRFSQVGSGVVISDDGRILCPLAPRRDRQKGHHGYAG